ncbi:hypothetical protein RJ639_040941 [Escallonia herrerae]|uniref:Methyltransferase type 11 domain-containing protein n=1 Tax=Escallonia herrerae TaxID=1293975 RepID=A0AA89B640_9ASTE|nr:hypothetical protein RJ639_040941 [Escallonia herrerae]
MRGVVGGLVWQRQWRNVRSVCTDDITDGFQSSSVKIFDRHLKRKQRDRAAWLMRPKDTLVDTVAENLLDRLEMWMVLVHKIGPNVRYVDEEISIYIQIWIARCMTLAHGSEAKWLATIVLDAMAVCSNGGSMEFNRDCKKTFPTALCLGGYLAAIRRLLRGRGAIEKLIMMDTSYDMVKMCNDAEKNMPHENIETSFIVGDEEFLPIKDSSLDLVISCLGLHWTNDLPGAMIQSRIALKPDGLFLAAILGGETLKELRVACTVAQMEREGGVSPRVSPLAQVRDAGNLLTRAGFTLPAVDVDEYTVRYRSGEQSLVLSIAALELIEHLRAMGETNALLQRNKILKRETALATAAVYESMFAAEDGTVPATFQVRMSSLSYKIVVCSK